MTESHVELRDARVGPWLLPVFVGGTAMLTSLLYIALLSVAIA